MAGTIVQPRTPVHDLVTYKEARRLFAQTPFPVSESTMRRWVQDLGLTSGRLHGVVYISWSDLLVAHGDWVAATAVVP
ncbi:hypothetical protein [Streptomyces hydrogenans]|uniref:hypothetical protein n=1 Tax=Streptomyces hydrogenans TaxID=1873719 RepID=UPI0036E919DE